MRRPNSSGILKSQTDHLISARWPDLIIKKEKKKKKKEKKGEKKEKN